MKHIVTLLVENKPGVLARIVGLISGRGYNIEGLTVAPTMDPEVSRMTIEVPGDDRVLEQVTKQLNKLIDVIKVTDLTSQRFIGQELVFVKVAAGEGGGVLVPLVRSDASGGALTGFLVELIYVENGAPLADGRGELRVDLPRADAPTSQLQWTVYFPDDAKVQKKHHEGTVRQVPHFSSAPQLPSDATVSAQAQGNVQRAAQNQGAAGALGQGVEPVRVELPLSGQTHTYEKMLVLEEPLWVSFEYVRRER